MKSAWKGEETRPYCVELVARVWVEVEVDARSVEEARAKAWEWNDGYRIDGTVIGNYYVGEDELFDDEEMYWETQCVECEDIEDVRELHVEDFDEA